MKKFTIILVLLAVTLLPEVVSAQCAMCKAVVESSADAELVEGVNNGILYMMGVPYLLMFVIGFAWYKHNNKGKLTGEDE